MAEQAKLSPAATVDGVTVSQEALVLSVPEQDARRRQAQLEVFVSEQLLANAAAREKLDVDPGVQAAMEIARRQSLARAYVARKRNELAHPPRDAVRAYYDEHPELFAKRRIYRLQEIVVSVSHERISEVEERFGTLKTFNERVGWLARNKVPYDVAVTVRPAEELPADLLRSLVNMDNGTAFNVPGSKGLTTVQITGLEDRPLSFEQANGNIEAYLINQRLGELIEQESGRLRGTAQIKYFGTYAAPTR